MWQIPKDVPNRPAQLTPGAVLRLAIEYDGHGYYLYANEIDGPYSFEEWHPSLKAAEQKAAQLFGPKSKNWQTVVQ
ncbi:MAG: hypothetical protein AAF821_09830 [Cyanobacteria bacterium P01_D01_bin.156]